MNVKIVPVTLKFYKDLGYDAKVGEIAQIAVKYLSLNVKVKYKM